MTVSRKVQEAITSLLTSNKDVQGKIAGRVYDNPPSNPTYPIVLFAQTSFTNENADLCPMLRYSVALEVMDRSGGAKLPGLELGEHVFNALNKITPNLGDDYGAGEIYVSDVSTRIDDDAQTSITTVSLSLCVEFD